MSNPSPPGARSEPQQSLERDVVRYERRERSGKTFWRSLSVLGTVGWSIALPAACGAWLGHRVDLRYGSGVRVTLMLLFAGVFLGSAIAARVLRSHRDEDV